MINELTVSQRRGVIILIPKEDSSLLEQGNWRPITLLNVDLKTAAKAIAKRLEPVLPKLIHPDQTGFVKGRYIREIVRLISDVMEYAKVQNIPGLSLSLDFRKAFDSLEWPFIMKTLDYFNFGADVKKWFKRGVVFINDLNENGKFLTFKEFSDKYKCQTNFLQYYQVISAIPTSLLTKAKNNATLNKLLFTCGEEIFKFNDNVEIHLNKARSKDFYNLLNNKTHMGNHSGPTRWNKSLIK